MITNFNGKTAVLTGAGSGFGLECARIGAKLGMNLVLADVQQDALDRTVAEMQAAGAQVLAMKVDVSKAEQVEALGAATLAFTQATVYDASGKACAHSTGTFKYVKRLAVGPKSVHPAQISTD